MNSIELFAGAGGLALATSKAGFHHKALVDWNSDACATMQLNQKAKHPLAAKWPIMKMSATDLDFKQFKSIDFLSGGPPCQPFSIGGKHRGQSDTRNLFPEMVRAIRELKPKAVLIENVRGLLRPKFAKFFEYILLQLTYPKILNTGESWLEHLAYLEKNHTKGVKTGLHYNVVFQCLNAADYGVPQQRHRVFLVGFRSDLNISWSFPKPSHSKEALLYDQFVSKKYWERHRIPKTGIPTAATQLVNQIERMNRSLFGPELSAWRTVRDAISDLPIPVADSDGGVHNHKLNPGGKTYPGHTGSLLDSPAKTLKAGDHGVPGGENMVVLGNGEVRYFTVRESARLQTFPDDYVFTGKWSESMRQLGNAVPVDLGNIVAKSIYKSLK